MAHEVVKVYISFCGIFCYSGVSNVHIFIVSVVDLAFDCCLLHSAYYVKQLGWFSPLLFPH